MPATVSRLLPATVNLKQLPSSVSPLPAANCPPEADSGRLYRKFFGTQAGSENMNSAPPPGRVRTEISPL